MIPRAWLFGVLIVGSGCSAATAPVVDAGEDAAIDAPVACVGAPLNCTILRGRCCEDTFFAQTCRAGTWVCDPCVLASLCGGERVTGLMRECTLFARDAPRMDMGVAEYCGLADGG